MYQKPFFLAFYMEKYGFFVCTMYVPDGTHGTQWYTNLTQIAHLMKEMLYEKKR